jgi:hypothetical protein
VTCTRGWLAVGLPLAWGACAFVLCVATMRLEPLVGPLSVLCGGEVWGLSRVVHPARSAWTGEVPAWVAPPQGPPWRNRRVFFTGCPRARVLATGFL